MSYPLHQLPATPRFSTLSRHFYRQISATPVSKPELVCWNSELAQELGLAKTAAEHGAGLAELLAGNQPLNGHVQLASVYSGHQFGVKVPQLGDGRAMLIAELTAPDGSPWELQLKGAGPTPFSRRADGRAVLRSSIREYLCSEAMHGLGIPTTRALALIHSPETPVWRETCETAAIVTRAAPSFLRFGHFEYFYYQNRHEQLKELADWAIRHYFPHCGAQPEPYLAFFEDVIQRTASLIARWQAAGFCHGVMNTDNMSILGLTLDYGPFGFMDAFDPQHICNHSDDTGRYAYQQQPQIGLWNLYCLGQALSPLIEREQLLAALDQYQSHFESTLGAQFASKLGFATWEESDWPRLTTLTSLLETSQTDWTIFWRTLSQYAQHSEAPPALQDLFINRPAFANWYRDYQQRLKCNAQITPAARQLSMLGSNPAYILRNHLAEQAIRNAEADRDYSEIHRLARCLRTPYEEQAANTDYAALPPDWAKSLAVSCSS